MPKYMNQIGLYDNPDCIMTKFAKELAGGLISRFHAFHNVFRPNAYDASPVDDEKLESNATEEDVNPYAELEKQDNVCYPATHRPALELELDNFAKQIVTTLNRVMTRSDLQPSQMQFQTDNSLSPMKLNSLMPDLSSPLKMCRSVNMSQISGMSTPKGFSQQALSINTMKLAELDADPNRQAERRLHKQIEGLQ